MTELADTVLDVLDLIYTAEASPLISKAITELRELKAMAETETKFRKAVTLDSVVALRAAVGSLLAVIYRDDGKYIDEYGLGKAIVDAPTVWNKLQVATKLYEDLLCVRPTRLELKKAFTKYGQHLFDCNTRHNDAYVNYPCNCGFDENYATMTVSQQSSIDHKP